MGEPTLAGITLKTLLRAYERQLEWVQHRLTRSKYAVLRFYKAGFTKYFPKQNTTLSSFSCLISMFSFPRILLAAFLSLLFSQSSLADEKELREEFRRPDTISFPESAPYSPQVAALGKKLFFDPRLSGAQNMSCASCHNPSFGWETPAALTIGALNEPLPRHAPTVENLAEAELLHWDGRVDNLEDQARIPITNPKIMNSAMPDLVARLSSIPGYNDWFAVLFQQGLTEHTILQSIATYERTLRSGRAPFDDWVDGQDKALSIEARNGLDLFVGKANCDACHSGWAFTDHEFYDTGLEADDIGRGKFDPQSEQAQYAFKTPSLRNVTLRSPYKHRGNLKTLSEVLQHYNSGGIKRASRSEKVSKLDLSDDEMDAIVTFLESLTAYDNHVAAPVLPPEVPYP